MEWLAEYGLFLAKAATVVVAIGLAAALVAGAAARQARAGRRTRAATPPEIVPLNREYRRMAAAFESAAMPRKALRARRKADKAERKARDREERRRLAGGGEGGRRRVFVIDFKGDLRASGVDAPARGGDPRARGRHGTGRGGGAARELGEGRPTGTDSARRSSPESANGASRSLSPWTGSRRAAAT